MVFVRIVLIILVPVIAMLVLAYTYVYIEKNYPRSIENKSKEELARWHHKGTLVDYLQSLNNAVPPPPSEIGPEEGETKHDSS